MGNNYFSILKNVGNKNEEEKRKIEDCMICYDSPGDVLIKPCGHTGICKECMKHSLKDK